MTRFAEKLRGFMYGRYGVDNLGRFLLALYFVLIALNLFLRNIIIQAAALIIAICLLLRMMSKNCYKRSLENRRFIALFDKTKTEIKLVVDRVRYYKTSRFRKCKHCKAILKLPNKKGSHTVRCPKCGQRFDVKI